MSGEAEYIQPGHHTLTTVLHGGCEAIEFVTSVFDAQVTQAPTPGTAGNLHAEVEIGDSRLLIGKGYWTDDSMKSAIWIYVPDADATYRRALSKGATSVREPADHSWGDRVCGIKDPDGNTWWIATHRPPPR
jgi:uncharacterized glyoxalase superfamily protein PhnB